MPGIGHADGVACMGVTQGFPEIRVAFDSSACEARFAIGASGAYGGILDASQCSRKARRY